MSTDDATGRLLLLDSATLYFRAFHAIPGTVTAPDGTPVGAVRGFLDMVAVLVERLRPGQVVACWDDDWRPAWRVALLPSYKAHRTVEGGGEEVPEMLGAQVEVIAELLAALGVPRVGAPGCEADDIIATLATRAGAAGTGVDVVSGDRDLLQLVDDAAGVRVVWIGRGVREAEIIDGGVLAGRYGLGLAGPGRAYADLAVLRGDPSDGLPGVAGIGEKTAAALLARHGDLAGVLAAVDAGDPAVRPAVAASLRAARTYLAVAPEVVAVLRDADVPPLPTAPGVGHLGDGLDRERLHGLAQRWGVLSPVQRLLAAMGAEALPGPDSAGGAPGT